MLIGVGFYSLVIGIVSAFFSSKDTKQSLLAKRTKMVEEFCKSLNIGKPLENKLIESISYSADKLAYLWLSPEEDIFSELTVQLRHDFLVAIHKELITSCEFFRGKDISFIVRVVPLLKPVFYKAGEVIWDINDYSSCGRLDMIEFIFWSKERPLFSLLGIRKPRVESLIYPR